jgi:hypothetical protein
MIHREAWANPFGGRGWVKDRREVSQSVQRQAIALKYKICGKLGRNCRQTAILDKKRLASGDRLQPAQLLNATGRLVDGPLQSILRCELWSGLEEVCERFWIGNSNSGYIVPTNCCSQMGIRTEGDEFYSVLIQGHIPKRVIEHRRTFQRLS